MFRRIIGEGCAAIQSFGANELPARASLPGPDSRPSRENIVRMSKTIVAVAFVLAAVTEPSAAQEWPARTITLVVPFAAGGGIDASARLQAAALGEILGQNVIVENVGAAAGTVGSARVARAAPDGYTLLIGNTGTHAFSQSLYQKPPYDAVPVPFDPN